MVLCDHNTIRWTPLTSPSLVPTVYPCNLPLPNREKNKLIVEAMVCHRVSHSILFSPQIFSCKCSFAMTCWSGTRPLASGTLSIPELHWDSSWLSCCCLESCRSCSFACIKLVPSCTPTVHWWVDVGVCQFKVLDLGQRGIQAGQPASSPATSKNGVSSTLLSRWGAGPALLSAAASEGQGQFFPSLNLSASSPVCHWWWGTKKEKRVSLPGPRPCTADKRQDQLSCVHVLGAHSLETKHPSDRGEGRRSLFAEFSTFG